MTDQRVNVPKLELGDYYRRIITALVGALLIVREDRTGKDQDLLDSFYKVMPAIFPDTESHDFYLGKGREIATQEIASAMLLTYKARNRTKHLFRTDIDSGTESAPLTGFE